MTTKTNYVKKISQFVSTYYKLERYTIKVGISQRTQNFLQEFCHEEIPLIKLQLSIELKFCILLSTI